MAKVTLRHRLARVHPFVWIGIAAVIGGLIAWPLGGWDEVELQSTKLPVVEPGEVVPGQQFTVSVDSAELTNVHPDGFTEPDPGWEFLILGTTVTNETDITEFSSHLGDDYFGVFTVDDGVVGWGTTLTDPDGYVVAGDPYLVSDGKYLPDLQPALPTQLILVYPIPEGTWQAGDELTIGIVDRTPFESTLGTGTTYGHAAEIAEVPIVVTQGEIASPEAEPVP